MNDAKPITACKLWLKTSASGRRYMVGRFGGLRVLVFEASDSEYGHTHELCFGAVPAGDRPQPHPDVDAAPPPARRYQPAADASASVAPRRFPTGAANAPRSAAKVAMADLDEPMPF